MLTAQLMATMDDAHLAAVLHAEFDPLTATDKEIELLKRFETFVGNRALISAAEDLEIEPEHLEALADSVFSMTELGEVLRILADHSIDTPEALVSKLKRADSFYDIASDAGDVISRLNDLVNTTL